MPLEWWQLAFAAFTSVMMAAITAWAQIQNRKWEIRTRRWEEMTQEAIDKSKAAADTGIETQHLLRENTEITKNTAENANGALRKLQQAAEHAMEMRNKMREKIATAERSQLTDELDAISDQYAIREKVIRSAEDSKNDKK